MKAATNNCADKWLFTVCSNENVISIKHKVGTLLRKSFIQNLCKDCLRAVLKIENMAKVRLSNHVNSNGALLSINYALCAL